MWNLPPEQLLEAVRAAEASACDDLLYYCYGWADQALFDAIGEYELRKELNNDECAKMESLFPALYDHVFAGRDSEHERADS
jgi:hypothetical protein